MHESVHDVVLGSRCVQVSETKHVAHFMSQHVTQIDAGAISFGQGVSVTAVQLISGICAVANEGKLMKPMLVKKILRPNGKELEVFPPTVVRQVVSSKTANIVKKMMNQVVQEEGTGTLAAMAGYRVCGKTSTAQKASKNGQGYAKNRYIAAFGGFAPQDNPELAILVVVDEPKESHYGGIVAAPAFKSIMSQSFNYLNIAPKNTMIAALTIHHGPPMHGPTIGMVEIAFTPALYAIA